MVLGFFRALCFLFLLLGCSNPYERDNPQDTIHTYTVTFNAGEAVGGVPPADITGHYGDVIQLPYQGGLMRYGFGLRKWKVDSLGKLISYEAGGRYTVTGNIAMSAVWVPIYSVAFDGNGATGGLPPAAVSVDSGTVTVLPANGTLERTGYSFGGWNVASPYMVSGNATLYAKWIPIYAVAFDGNGATSGLPPAAVSAGSGTVIELPANGTLERAGYSFAGWDVVSPYTVAGNATLYAKWVPVYAVSFDGNGATSGLPPAAVSADSGTVIELPDVGSLEMAGYFFASWNTDNSGTGASYDVGSNYAVAGNATLYAVWSLTPTFACAMTATAGTVGTAISPAPTVSCNGTAVTAGLAWTPASLTPTAAGNVAVSVSASSGVCSGMTAKCGSVNVLAPTLTCTMTATTGTVGTAISPTPTVSCSGTAVTAGLAWTPANLTPASTGSLAVSVSASSGTCAGMTANCGSISVLAPTLACTMTATTGTLGTAISPTPTVSCNGTAVTDGLAWTPASITPTTTGSVSVSVSASSGVCAGMTANCGSVSVAPSSSSSSAQPISSSVAPSSSSSSAPPSSSSVAPSSSSSPPVFACTMTATAGTVGVQISPTPTVTCNGTAVSSGLAWTPASLIPTTSGNVAVSVSASSGVCAGMTATCRSITVSPPTLTCTMTATTGTVGVQISPTPAVTCNGTAVSSGLAWTPANLTPTAAGSVAVSVSASSGVCAGMTKACGSVDVSYASCPVSSVSNNSVTCGGQTYKTIVIGTQTWMAENLNYDVSGSKCYSNQESNCNTYGRLYNWATAMSVCPSGWHLPTSEEWNTLSNYVQSNSGCSSCDARLLKATSGWYSGNGTDQYGFSALPGGYGDSVGSFDYVGYYGNWWSASEYNSSYAYRRNMYYHSEYAYWYYNGKSLLFSVRCLQD